MPYSQIAWLDPQLDGFFLVCFFAQLFASIRCPLSNRANSPRIDGFPRNVLIPNPLTALRSSNCLRPLSRRNSRRCCSGFVISSDWPVLTFLLDDKKLPIPHTPIHCPPSPPATRKTTETQGSSPWSPGRGLPSKGGSQKPRFCRHTQKSSALRLISSPPERANGTELRGRSYTRSVLFRRVAGEPGDWAVKRLYSAPVLTYIHTYRHTYIHTYIHIDGHSEGGHLKRIRFLHLKFPKLLLSKTFALIFENGYRTGNLV